MAIITQESLDELNRTGGSYQYALSPNRRDFFLSSSGRTLEESFVDLGCADYCSNANRRNLMSNLGEICDRNRFTFRDGSWADLKMQDGLGTRSVREIFAFANYYRLK